MPDVDIYTDEKPIELRDFRLELQTSESPEPAPPLFLKQSTKDPLLPLSSPSQEEQTTPYIDNRSLDQATTHLNIKREDVAAEACCGFLLPAGVIFIIAGCALNYYCMAGAAVIGGAFIGVGFGLVALIPLLLLAIGIFSYAFSNHKPATLESPAAPSQDGKEQLTLALLDNPQQLFFHDDKTNAPENLNSERSNDPPNLANASSILSYA